MTTQKMLSVLRKGVEKYKMIKAGDKIAVGISGGKDSITLFKLLAEYRRFSPEPFELMGISVDLGFNGKRGDFSRIKELADGYGVPYIVEETDIAEVVFNVRKEKSPCALCSKMRKGALYDAAKREGCNKAALGHHSDDLIDTFLLSLFYEGRLSTFAPKSYLDRTGITLIRPMIMLREADIISYSKDLPVTKSCCPANDVTKRQFVKDAAREISRTVPNVREMIYTALTHPERYNLFDKFEKEVDLF